jgi:hypothetical protein
VPWKGEIGKKQERELGGEEKTTRTRIKIKFFVVALMYLPFRAIPLYELF